MSLLLGLALLALLGGVAWLVDGALSPEVSGVQEGASSLPRSVDAPLASTSPIPARSAADRVLDIESADLGQVVGRVCTRTREPLPGATITILDSPRAIAGRSSSSTAARDGSFSLTLPPTQTVRIAVSHEGHARRIHELGVRHREMLDLGDIVLLAAASVRGRVVDPSGAGIAGATVSTAEGLATSCDAAGEFALHGLAPGERRLLPEASGYAPRPTPPLRLASGRAATDIVLTMEPAVVLRGSVSEFAERGEQGPPIGGVRIEARVGLANADFGSSLDHRVHREAVVAISDAAGRFELSPLPRGILELRAQHPAYHDFGRRCNTDGAETSIVLTPAGSVRGSVVDASTRQPVAIDRITLFASQDEEDGPWRPIAEPWPLCGDEADRGAFHVPARSSRFLKVLVEGPRIAPITSAPFRLDRKTRSAGPLRLEASAGTSLLCVAVDESGQPIAGAGAHVIRVDDDRRAWTPRDLVTRGIRLARNPVTTNGAGEAPSNPLAPGTYRVVLRRAGYFHGISEGIQVVEGQAPPRTSIVMTRAGSIRGRVSSVGGGTTPADLAVLVLGWDTVEDEPVDRARVEFGRFELPRLATGKYRVRLVDAGDNEVVFVEKSVDLRVGHPLTLDFDLEEVGAAVRGIYLLNGSPMPDATVTLGRRSERPTWSATTDAHGTFHFAGVAEGAYILRAQTDADQACYGLAPVRVEAGVDRHADLQFTTTAVRGRVVDTMGDPLSRVPVVFLQEIAGRPEVLARTRSDREGYFEALQLPTGPLKVSTEARYYGNVHLRRVDTATHDPSTPLELVLDRTGDLVFHLERRPGMKVMTEVSIQSVRDEVVDPDRAMAPSADISKTFAAGARLQLAELDGGPHRFRISTADGFEALATARVVPGKTRTVVVVF